MSILETLYQTYRTARYPKPTIRLDGSLLTFIPTGDADRVFDAVELEIFVEDKPNIPEPRLAIHDGTKYTHHNCRVKTCDSSAGIKRYIMVCTFSTPIPVISSVFEIYLAVDPQPDLEPYTLGRGVLRDIRGNHLYFRTEQAPSGISTLLS
jgi:hypothetical protein